MLATIGYEGASLDDFIRTLKDNKIEHLIDVRERAQSRRPGFSKTALSSRLGEAGISYTHLRELGDPKEGREAARAGDFDSFRNIYKKVLKTDKARIALEIIATISREQRSCLLCYERDPLTCHRKMISDKISADEQVEIRHLGVLGVGASKVAKRRVLHSREGAAAPV